MEVIEKVIEYRRPDKFPIYGLGDIHLGVIHCDENLLTEKVREIKGEKNAEQARRNKGRDTNDG